MSDVAVQPRTIEFVVFGLPAPKGSKRGFAVHRKDGSTGVAMVESAGDRLKDWIRRVESSVQGLAATMPGMLEGPISAQLEFTMPRPKAVRRDVIWHTKRPDVDKLARCILDVCSSVLYADDAQVARLVAEKVYVVGELAPGVKVTLGELT